MRNSIRKIGALSQKINPLVLSQNHHRQAAVESQRVAQSASAQASSHGGSSERRQRVRSNRANGLQLSLEAISSRANAHEHKIDIGDENTDLLGQCLVSGKLTPDKKYSKSKEDSVRRDEKSRKPRGEVNSKLTEKAFIWGSHSLNLSDIVAVSYSEGLRRFTIHAYPLAKKSWISSKTERKQKDLHFLAVNADDAIRWVSAFADLQCFVNCLPHPLLSSKPHDSELSLNDFPPAVPVKCKVSPVMLVILNPRSGRGRSSKLYYGKVEPIFKVAGFSLEVIETTSAGHARNIAKTYDLIKCRDGIICVGGDGIVNEVLNGLISRDDPKEAMSVPIGIIPAGSDNSLVWTVLGVKDPISAAVAIVKGGLTATDVFAVEWISSGAIHAGLTVAYYGFVSDVLELSEKYQKRFGPLRYFVAGALKFFCLPKYDYVVEYLPVPEPSINNSKNASQGGNADMSENNLNNCGRRANAEGMPRASSLSSIDSILSTSNRSTSNRLASEIDDITSGTSGTYASTEPSDYVRGIDPKTKRMSSGKHNVLPEPEEVVHPPVPGLITPTRSRKVKLNVDKGWTGAGTANDFTRSAYGNPGAFDREEISSTVSDPGPGPIWDAEPRWDEGPKWDAEPKWDEENSLDVKESIDEMIIINEVPRREEEKWVTSHGPFLGVLVCNHPCRTVQNLRTQVLAPRAEHDDNALDMLLVRGLSRINLLRFFLLMQFGRHLSLPYVEYVKVKAVRISPGKNEHKGCGIDGELLQLNGPVSTTLLPEQIRLIGKPARSAT